MGERNEGMTDLLGVNDIDVGHLHSFGECLECGAVELLSWALLCRPCHEADR